MPIPAGGPGTSVDWAPDLVKVADRVPGRTLVASRTADGSNTEVMTFDETTRPPAASVLRLINDSVAWVMTATGPTIDPSLFGAATACAAVYTAASIQRGYPERQTSDQQVANTTADDLFKQADDMLKKLAARNDVLIGQNPAIFELQPVWSFPRADTWGDYPFL